MENNDTLSGKCSRKSTDPCILGFCASFRVDTSFCSSHDLNLGELLELSAPVEQGTF